MPRDETTLFVQFSISLSVSFGKTSANLVIREVLLYFPATLRLQLALAQVRATGKRGGTFRLANAAARDAVLLGRVQPIAEGHAAQTFRQPGALCQWRQACLPAYVNASKGSS